MLAAVGCSLIVPLDEYVGGGGAGAGGVSSGGSAGFAPLGGSGGASGQTALGGTSGDANGARGGSGAKGGSAGSEGGSDNGGSPDTGGMAGEDNGGEGPTSGRGGTRGGSAGSAGGGMAGTTAGSGGGETAGMGGVAGLGGRGGMSGMGGMAGTGGCGNVDLQTDEEHCGSCEIACESNEECLEGHCASSPCDGICTTFSSVTLSPGMGYKRDNIGTGEVCAEVTGYDVSPEPPSLVCWNFNGPTSLELNGTVINCTGVGQEFDVPLRLGGYCVHVAPGQSQFRGFEFPN